MTYFIATVITFIFTTVLTIAGVGAAFILIPVFVALGVPLLTAMSTALLLNSIAMAVASFYNAKAGLIVYKTALPILIFATLLSPLGAITAEHLSRTLLLWLFVAFLIFAGSMMLWYTPKKREISDHKKLITYGTGVGAFAGYIGGLLGVGGGNLIVPALVWLGFDPKKSLSYYFFYSYFFLFFGILRTYFCGQHRPQLTSFMCYWFSNWCFTGKLSYEKKIVRPTSKKCDWYRFIYHSYKNNLGFT